MGDEPDAGGAPAFEDELEYRTRGRPRLPEGQRRREKLIISLNAEEMREVMHRAADAPGGPKRLQDWARSVLLADATGGVPRKSP